MVDSKYVLFYRDFKKLTGGHIKVWHYFNHVRESGRYRASVFFTRRSLMDATNPWAGSPEAMIGEWLPETADILFIGGKDWMALSRSFRHRPPVPIINLVQHVSHADPKTPMYWFLQYPAIRICVSEEVREAIASTSRVNGPMLVIPNGIDLEGYPGAPPGQQPKHTQVLIAALKQPEIGRIIAQRLKLRSLSVTLLTERIPHEEYLKYVAQSEIAICLPHRTEGFYLPALEAMAMQCLTICPDCVGNRGYQRHKINSIQANTIDDIIESVGYLLNLSSDEKRSMIEAGMATASLYSMDSERESFMDILDRVNSLWGDLV